MTNRNRSIAVLSFAIGVGVVVLGSAEARAGLCPNCSNSATVGDGIVFDELNVNLGVRRPGGPAIVKVTLHDKPATLQVKRHFLSAVEGGKTYEGEGLIGLLMELEVPDGRAYEVKLVDAYGCHPETSKAGEPPSKAADAKLKAYDTRSKAPDPKSKPADQKSTICVPNPFWVGPTEDVPHFFFRVRKLRQRRGAVAGAAAAAAKRPAGKADKTRQPCTTDTCQPYKPDYVPANDDRAPEPPDYRLRVCEAKYLEKDPSTNELRKAKGGLSKESWKDVEREAITFEGDHYDAEHKQVWETEPKEGWFNFACAGTAVAKMHMLRHTRAGSIVPSGPAKATSLLQRTAMLKAITADYCGDGTAWTGDGTPLQWTDSGRWFPTPPLNLAAMEHLGLIEAVWGPDGALCLNTPRRQTKVPGLVYVEPPPGTTPACTAPAVTRSEVRAACRGMGNMYMKSPAEPTAPPRAAIPFCDEEWIRQWKMMKGPYRPHVVTVNMAENPAVYCDWP